MLTCNVTLRQCVRALSPRAIPIANTRRLLPPSAPCLVQQRTRSWFSRLLGTGFNSVKKSKGRASRQAVKKKPASTRNIKPDTQDLRKPARQAKNETASEPIAGTEPDSKSWASTLPSTASASKAHDDLRSFRRWSTKNGANKESTTYIGTEYEYTVSKALNTWYGMILQRRGGANDQGIDLIGDWKPPGDLPNFKILVQCKVSQPKSSFARELEGACSGGLADWRGDDVLAILASPKASTRGMWQTMQRSPRPMCFARISQKCRVVDFLFNEVANKAGFGKLEKHTIFVPSKEADGKNTRSRRGTALSARGRRSSKKFDVVEALVHGLCMIIGIIMTVIGGIFLVAIPRMIFGELTSKRPSAKKKQDGQDDGTYGATQK